MNFLTKKQINMIHEMHILRESDIIIQKELTMKQREILKTINNNQLYFVFPQYMGIALPNECHMNCYNYIKKFPEYYMLRGWDIYMEPTKNQLILTCHSILYHSVRKQFLDITTEMNALSMEPNKVLNLTKESFEFLKTSCQPIKNKKRLFLLHHSNVDLDLLRLVETPDILFENYIVSPLHDNEIQILPFSNDLEKFRLQAKLNLQQFAI